MKWTGRPNRASALPAVPPPRGKGTRMDRHNKQLGDGSDIYRADRQRRRTMTNSHEAEAGSSTSISHCTVAMETQQQQQQRWQMRRRRLPSQYKSPQYSAPIAIAADLRPVFHRHQFAIKYLLMQSITKCNTHGLAATGCTRKPIYLQLSRIQPRTICCRYYRLARYIRGLKMFENSNKVIMRLFLLLQADDRMPFFAISNVDFYFLSILKSNHLLSRSNKCSDHHQVSSWYDHKEFTLVLALALASPAIIQHTVNTTQ